MKSKNLVELLKFKLIIIKKNGKILRLMIIRVNSKTLLILINK